MRHGGSTLSNIEKSYPVLLTIRGEQYFENIDPDVTTLQTDGVLEVLDDGYRFHYEETEITGMEGTHTSFELHGPVVVLTRTGSVNSEMIFEEGKPHMSLYETPFGELAVDIITNKVRTNLTENGGIMEIRFGISIDHTLTGENCFKIRMKRKS